MVTSIPNRTKKPSLIEAVFDRMFCDTLTDAVETQLNVQYGDYDFGDTVATDQNGNKYYINNPWF